MSWSIKMHAYGETETVEVEGADLDEALTEALHELGVGGNDEASMTLEVSGDAGGVPSGPAGEPKQKEAD